MKWVTRARPKTDRIACPWLIRRFIDPDAEILYVPTDQVLDRRRRPGRDRLRHARRRVRPPGRCTFEVLIDEYDLGGDPALVRLARIVHAADIDGEIDTDPAGPGLLAIGVRWPRRRSRRPPAPRTRDRSSTTRSTPGAAARSRPRHERAPRLRRPPRRHRPPSRQAHGRRRHHRTQVRRAAVPRRQAPLHGDRHRRRP